MSERKHSSPWHLPLPRRAKLIKREDVVNQMGTNMKIAVFITEKVGSMWAAYLFAALTLISLPAAIASGNVLVIIAWIAQTFLQLVLLPIIMVGQNLQGKHTEVMADEEFKTTQTTYKDLEHLILVNQQQLDLLVKLAKDKNSTHSTPTRPSA